MLKKMAMHIGSVSVVLIAIMLFASLSSILLGRLLSEADFGKFSLMRMLVLFLPFLAIWGQGIATARFFSKSDPGRYQWPVAFVKIMAVSTLLSLVGVLVAALIYHLEWYQTGLLFVAVVVFCANLLMANMVRSQRRYPQAVMMENGFRGAFFFILLLVYLAGSLSAVAAITLYLGLVIVSGVVNVYYIRRSVPSGDQTVPAEMHKTGLILMGIEASVDVLSSLDTLFIPRFLGFAALGLYSATLVPAQIFNILARAAKYVWVPEFGRSDRTRFRLLTAAVALLAVTMSMGLYLAAQPIMHFLYKGRYDQGVTLLRILAISGMFRLQYSLSSSLIVGRLGQDALLAHLYITILSMVLYIGLLAALLIYLGVIGAAWALLIATVFRAVASYWIVLRYGHGKT
jgi:O-antigen/teichoic acid export membrane protein